MMKNLMITLGILAAGVAGANATTLLQDDFSYVDGSLVGNTPPIGGIWTNHSGTIGDIQVSSETVLLSDSASEDASSLFAVAATGSLFYGFDVSVEDPGSYTGTDFEYFAHFYDSSGNFDFRSRVDVVDFTATGFKFGFSAGSSTADAIWATELSYGTTYRLVASFDLDTGAASLWVNPTSVGSTSITSTGDVAAAGLDGFAFRQSSATPDMNLTIDNLSVGTEFGDVAAVPEPGTVALVGLGLVGALYGMRRRRM